MKNILVFLGILALVTNATAYCSPLYSECNTDCGNYFTLDSSNASNWIPWSSPAYCTYRYEGADIEIDIFDVECSVWGMVGWDNPAGRCLESRNNTAGFDIGCPDYTMLGRVVTATDCYCGGAWDVHCNETSDGLDTIDFSNSFFTELPPCEPNVGTCTACSSLFTTTMQPWEATVYSGGRTCRSENQTIGGSRYDYVMNETACQNEVGDFGNANWTTYTGYCTIAGMAATGDSQVYCPSYDYLGRAVLGSDCVSGDTGNYLTGSEEVLSFVNLADPFFAGVAIPTTTTLPSGGSGSGGYQSAHQPVPFTAPASEQGPTPLAIVPSGGGGFPAITDVLFTLPRFNGPDFNVTVGIGIVLALVGGLAILVLARR